MEFEKISVGDIAKQCHISRNTFYYHFKDKYDIINWIFYSEIQPIIGTNQSMNNWFKSLLALCQYMQQNKEFYIKVLRIQGQNSFYECLVEFYASLVEELLLNFNKEQVLNSGQIRMISNFYAFGLTGVISTWAKNGMKGDPTSAVYMLKQLLSGEIFDMISSLPNTHE